MHAQGSSLRALLVKGNTSTTSCSPEVHNSAWCALLQIVQQQVGQVEWSKVIDAQSHLEVFLSSVCWRYEHTRVVDEDMQRILAFLELIGKASNRATRAETF